LYQGITGIAVFILMAWLASEHRSSVAWKTVITGLGLQFAVAVVLVKAPVFSDFFVHLNRVILSLEESTRAGTAFVFGYLGGGELPFAEKFPGASFVLAFQALPLVLVVSALSSLLFHWRVLPRVVKGFSWALQRTLGIGGTEGVGVSANIFVGMVESPLLIRPYLRDMTRSEIFSVMTCGMATIAGTVMVLYAGILNEKIPGIMGHILTASIISAPAAVVVAKLMVPETKAPTLGELIHPEITSGAMDAVTKGTLQGIQLLINIIGMIVVLVALVHLVNLTLALLPGMGGSPLTLQRLLGYAMAPVMWLIGIPWHEAGLAGSLMGTKTVLNEFLAYLELARLEAGTLSERSTLILTYALCGFANPGSLGIMIGGMGAMAPERRDEIVAMGFRSIFAGTLTTCMTGAVIGIVLAL